MDLLGSEGLFQPRQAVDNKWLVVNSLRLIIMQFILPRNVDARDCLVKVS